MYRTGNPPHRTQQAIGNCLADSIAVISFNKNLISFLPSYTGRYQPLIYFPDSYLSSCEHPRLAVLIPTISSIFPRNTLPTPPPRSAPRQAMGKCEFGAASRQGQQSFHKPSPAWHKEDVEGAAAACTAKSTCGNPRNVNQKNRPRSPGAVLTAHLARCGAGQTALPAGRSSQPEAGSTTGCGSLGSLGAG